MKSFKEYIIEGKEPTYYHSTNKEYNVGDIISASKNNRGYFGQWENLFHKHKPNSEVSRLNSLYLTKQRWFSEQFGVNTYKVIPVGNYSSCAFGWLAILMSKYDHLVKGFNKKERYLLSKPNKNEIEEIRYFINQYYSGKIPTAREIRKYDYESDSETKVKEILTNKMKIIKKL